MRLRAAALIQRLGPGWSLFSTVPEPWAILANCSELMRSAQKRSHRWTHSPGSMDRPCSFSTSRKRPGSGPGGPSKTISTNMVQLYLLSLAAEDHGHYRKPFHAVRAVGRATVRVVSSKLREYRLDVYVGLNGRFPTRRIARLRARLSA
jgi:hypothetical protein